MAWFTAFSLLGAGLVVGCARWFRGRFFSRFATVLVVLHLLSTLALFSYVKAWWPIIAYLQATVFIHLLSLSFARLRPWWWRWTISIPGLFFWAGAFLALPWAAAAAVDLTLPGLAFPFVLAAFGTLQSHTLKRHDVHIDLTEARPPIDGVKRHPQTKTRTERPLRIVQITDPHLGPFMSPERLAKICQRAVDQDPDLIVVTGDLLTMEAHHDVDAVTRAFMPLSARPGRVFACLGNHDLEALDTVTTALEKAGVHLLIDDATVVETDAGPVQVVGMDFVWRNRATHMADVCRRYPRKKDHLRLVLLHDPSAFFDLPDREGDLVLSGHTHGGQLGLVSWGLPYTFLSFFPQYPDHGLWGRGADRLYVHRGTGHYGFPVRIGVPAEESVLFIHRS